MESYLTHRLEEFEIEEELVENLADDGYALMLAADCGTSSSRALKKAALRSLQVVVLDHHLSDGTELPEEHLYINPHLDEWPEGVRRLSSSGIAYFFLQGMEAMTPGLREKGVAGLVEVAALGTLGDSVPLLGDNRIIVKEGLKRLPLTQLTGLRQFIENIGLGSRVKCLDVIMKINPRLNAPGRFGRPEVALKVFLEEEEKELPLVFREIEEYDRKRSSLIQRLMRNWPEAEGQSGAVTSLKDFPASLCGVVASRLVERTGRPAMVCARTGELIRGSARSAGDFDLYWRLCKYRENFISFGGHSRAVGFTLVATRLKELEAIWRETVADFEPGLARPSPEEVLPLERLTVELVAELNSLEPYGPGNPRPLFM
ncbi:MAG TPA: hypothetical protein PKW42_11935, partial [bacterium]|nr:hypothetical protein [bacterium]